MKKILQFAIPAFVGLFSCFPISAQMRAGAAFANSRRVQPAQPRLARPIIRSPGSWKIQTAFGTQLSSPVTVVHVATNGHPPSSHLIFINPGDIESENGVPGLGFDFPHLAAISGNLHFDPPFEHHGLNIDDNSFVPFFFSENPEFRGVPGLGFDFPHLAAISGHLHFNPAFEHDRLGRNDNSFVPIFWGDNSGSSEYIDPSVIQQIQQEFQQQGQPQPQIIVIQQPAPVGGDQISGRVPQASPNSPAPSIAPSVTSPVPVAPVRDVGEFILVRRDGRILFASAFYVSGGVLQYVTPESIRRTVAVAELDVEATRKMNEALGTKVDLLK